MGSPQTLPANFSGWDKPPDSLPANFDQWDKSAAAPAQPSALSRLGTNFASGAGVVSEQQGKDFFIHPVDALKAMAAQQGELGARAGKELENADYVRGLTHGIEWLLPGLGPVLAKSGDQLEQKDYAGGIGTTLGAAANLVAAHYAPAAADAGASAVTAAGGKVSDLLDAAKQTTPKQAGQAVGAVTGAGLGHGTLSVPGAYYGAKGAGSMVESVLGKERANAPIVTRPIFPGAPLPENPGTFPGASLPATPSLELLQARGLTQGGAVPHPEPAAALGSIPQRYQPPAVSASVPEIAPAAAASPQPASAADATAVIPKRFQPPAATAKSLEQRLGEMMQNLENEKRNIPAKEEEDLTDILQKSLQAVRAKKAARLAAQVTQ